MKMLIALAVLFFLSSSAWPAPGHEVEPFWKNDDGQCSAWGYTVVTFGPGREVLANNIRPRIECRYRGWASTFEVDLAGLDNAVPANYLVQGFLGYTFDNDSRTTVRAGRIWLAAHHSSPVPWNMATIEGAKSDPFTPLGVGIQFETRLRKDLVLMTDVTNATEVGLFVDQRNWERIETSQWLSWNAVRDGEHSVLNLTFSNQSGDGIQRNGMHFSYHPTHDLALSASVARNEQNIPGFARSKWVGGHVLADYKVARLHVAEHPLDLRVHGMLDKTSGTMNYEGATAGLSLALPEDSGYGKAKGSAVSVDFTGSKLQINNGPEINDKQIMVRFKVFF